MIQLCIVALTLSTLVFMSTRANRRFGDRKRLPMQWSVSGAVNWTAPRSLALAFTPVLAAAILVPTIVASFALAHRPGQDGHVAPVVAIMSIAFVGAHALHLWLIERMARRNGS